MKFPVNGWQRSSCAQCLYFGGETEPGSAVTVCKYPRLKQGEDLSEVSMKKPTAEELENPEVAAKVNAHCHCCIGLDYARDHFRLLMQATVNN